MKVLSLCAAAVLVLAPACGREAEPRQPERVVKVARIVPAETGSPVPVQRESPPPSRLPKPTPAPRDSVAAMKAYIHEVFGPHGAAAVRVAACESINFRPDVVAGRKLGAAGEVGLWQIIPKYHAWRAKGQPLADWKVNTRVAHALFLDEGWRPWTCARLLGIS